MTVKEDTMSDWSTYEEAFNKRLDAERILALADVDRMVSWIEPAKERQTIKITKRVS